MVILLFGATGTAGGGVLGAALADPAVTEVRAVLRRAPALDPHPRLRPIPHQDFMDYSALGGSLAGVDACFFCLGISVRQVSGEAEYRRITRDYAVAAAAALREASPSAGFHYLSGQGARAGSRFMWARVKAEAERELIEQYDATCWRPGFIDGADSASTPRLYQRIRPVFRLLRSVRWLYVSGEQLGRAMLRAARGRVRGRVIENAEIRRIAE